MTATPSASTSSLARRPPWRAKLLFAPLLLWLLLFVVAPTAILLIYSFYTRGDGPGEIVRAFTWENYRRCFAGLYLQTFAWSIGYALLTTALCLAIGFPVAFHIGRQSPAWRNRLVMLIMIPFWTSFLIRAYAWMAILSHDGLLNAFLHASRLIPLVFAGDVELLYTAKAVVLALVYSYLPFMILPIYASVEKLDESLIEAALDLGAGPIRAFIRVILPLTFPGIAAGIVMVFIPAVAMFAVTTLMSGGRIRLIGDEIQSQSIEAGNLPFGAALGMVLLGLFVASSLLFLIRGRKPAG